MVAKFRENLVLRRVARLEVENGIVVRCVPAAHAVRQHACLYEVLQRHYALALHALCARCAGSYAHNTVSPGVGKIASMVAIESKTPLEAAAAEKCSETGRLIAMHVVAANPLALTRDTVDTDALQVSRHGAAVVTNGWIT